MLRKVTVEIVVMNDSLARVESGIKAGDQLVGKPIQALYDGEAIKID